MRCWGLNGDGQVGLVAALLPAFVRRLFEEAHNLLTPCLFEQLGNGSIFASSSTPVNVSGLSSGVVSVALGYVCF